MRNHHRFFTAISFVSLLAHCSTDSAQDGTGPPDAGDGSPTQVDPGDARSDVAMLDVRSDAPVDAYDACDAEGGPGVACMRDGQQCRLTYNMFPAECGRSEQGTQLCTCANGAWQCPQYAIACLDGSSNKLADAPSVSDGRTSDAEGTCGGDGGPGVACSAPGKHCTFTYNLFPPECGRSELGTQPCTCTNGAWVCPFYAIACAIDAGTDAAFDATLGAYYRPDVNSP